MSAKVKLSHLVDAIQLQSDELQQFLHKPTGKIYAISDEEFGYAENDKPLEQLSASERALVKIADEILGSNEYVQLPDKFDVNEYSIMERFCLTIENEAVRKEVCHSIKGSGAFHRFRDELIQHNIENNWFEFRENAFYSIAVDWCEYNNISYKDDREK